MAGSGRLRIVGCNIQGGGVEGRGACLAMYASLTASAQRVPAPIFVFPGGRAGSPRNASSVPSGLLDAGNWLVSAR